MRVLVIGGNSYLARAFANKCAERFEILTLRRGPGMTTYFDLGRKTFEGFDAVVNFVAIVHCKIPDPDESELVNAQLPAHLARLAKEAGVKHFVQISTVAVYGDRLSITDTTPPNPNTLYGRTKLAGDNGVQALEDDRFAVTLLRPTVIYGPGAPGNMKSLLRFIAWGVPLPFGNSENCRAILYVDNLVTALERVISRCERGIFLLRDTCMPSLQQICRELGNGLGKKPSLFPLPKWLIILLLRFGPALFQKLYGDFIVDDRRSIERLGHYATVPYKTALQEMSKEKQQ